MTEDHDAVHRYQGRGLGAPLTARPTIVDQLRYWAVAAPEAVYMVAVAADGTRHTTTFGELERRSACLSAWLRRTLGLGPGDIVALLPRNDMRSVITIFALLRAGCSVFFINPAEPSQRLGELLEAVPLAAVLAPTPEVAARTPVTATIPELDVLPLPDPLPDDPPLAADAGALLFGTSGSTATSKLVSQSHYNAAINAEALRRHHRLGPGVRVLGCLPIHHVNGLHFTLLATLWSGAQAVLLDAFNPRQYPRILAEHRPAIASVVPSILEALLLTWREPSLPPGFSYFVSAAAPLRAQTCQAVHARLGARVLQGYGLTETTNFSTTMPIELTDDAHRRLALDAEIPSIGVALHGNEVAVLRPDGTPAEPGEIGEICMRGHNVMLGYLGNEAGTAEAFRHGWFHSQDLGYALDDEPTGQTFFFITGRSKSMAKVMGIAVSLEEMERALLRLPELSDAACFAVPDPLAGEALVAVVVSAAFVEPSRLAAHLEGYFNPVVIPRRFVSATAIPRTATGKLIRSQLPALFAPGVAASSGAAP